MEIIYSRTPLIRHSRDRPFLAYKWGCRISEVLLPVKIFSMLIDFVVIYGSFLYISALFLASRCPRFLKIHQIDDGNNVYSMRITSYDFPMPFNHT
jgi:hypothetical protein